MRQRANDKILLGLIVLVALGSATLIAGEQESNAAGAPATQGSEEPESTSALPAGVVARLDGRNISVDEYVGYLWAALGKSKLDDYIDRLLIEGEAKRLEIAVRPERVEEVLEERVERTIQALYQGSRDRFVETLKKRRMSLEEYEAKLRQDLYYDLLVEAMVLKGREITEEGLRREFERIYGEGGVEPVLRHILIAIFPASGAETARSETEARERAEKVLKEIQGGADFVQAVNEYSDDHYTRENEGRIPKYRKRQFGDAFHAAVTALTDESPTSGVVASPRGYHIIRLVEKQTTRYEDVEEDLKEALKKRPPSPRERHELLTRLRAGAKIEGL